MEINKATIMEMYEAIRRMQENLIKLNRSVGYVASKELYEVIKRMQEDIRELNRRIDAIEKKIKTRERR